MNRDLEETLEELGPEYRGVVNRLRAAQEVSPAHSSARVQARIGLLSSAARVVAAAGLLAAACVAVAVKFGGPGASSVTPRGGSASFTGEYSLAYTGDVESLLRTQNADGSWANDFLTRQNAAALRGAKGADEAYRRAVRYLRMKGLSPLSDGELRERGAFAAQCAANG